MGNRSSNSRRKQRDNAYVYSDNRRNDYSSEKNNGSINRRSNQPAQTFNYNSYPNGYGINPTIPQTNSYPKPNTNSSSNIDVFLVDFISVFLR